MFESSLFLDFSLPKYFIRTLQSQQPNPTSVSSASFWLTILSEFLNFAEETYRSFGLENQFHFFLNRHFAFLELPVELRNHSAEENRDSEQKSKIMEKIE